MSIGPAHVYISNGISRGYIHDDLKRIVDNSTVQQSHSQFYLHSLGHLCHCSGASYHYLRKVIQRKTPPYDHLTIPKRNGGMRYLSAPEPELKSVQRWINQHVLSSVQPHWRCYSYTTYKTIYDAASEHCKAKWLIKLDIENFFDSVSENKVYRLFRKLKYSPLVSFELSRLCTIEPKRINQKMASKWVNYNTASDQFPYERKGVKYFGRLPQGAPTSPAISNLIFHEIDEEIFKLAKEQDLTYTRYADDICISACHKRFGREEAVSLIDAITKVLRQHDFATKKIKTKIISPGARKVVLGLNVDHDKPKLTKAFKKRVEGHIRGVKEFGVIAHCDHKNFNSVYNMLDHVSGLINHARTIDEAYAIKILDEYRAEIYKQGFA